jgi:hypothetical protein
MVLMNNHREEEFEALGNDTAKKSLRNRLLVLAKHVLEALVKNHVNLIYL